MIGSENMNKTKIAIIVLAAALVITSLMLVGNEIGNYIDNVNQTSYMQGVRDTRLAILQEIYNDLSDDGRMTILFPINETAYITKVVEKEAKK